MSANALQFDAAASIIFIGNSYTFGRVDPVMHYNSANVRDLTAPSNGGTFTNTTGSNPYEPHPWGGVPGLFKQFTVEAGLSYDVAISARNAASLQGHYLNSNPAGWDLRGNLASQAWDTVVLQDNSTQALPSGAGSISFAAGSSTATLTIRPIADTTQETDETLGITLAANPSSYRVGTTSTITGTILNDDPTGPVVNPALPTVTLSASPSAVPEDSGSALVYTFTRTGPADTALTINFTAFRDGATSPSVATSGTSQDFVATNGSVFSIQSGGASTTGNVSFTSNTGSIVIPAGQTTATITLVPKADTTVENDESMRFTLSSNNAYNVGTQGPVSVTIVNDDFAPGTDTSLPNITLSLATPAVYEDASGNLVYTFTRSGSNAQALTVNFGVNGTATLPGNDFAVTGAKSFSTGGASDPNLASFQTYAVKLAQYATTGAADGTVPANTHANAATDVYLYETWARPNLVTGARVATTDDTTGAITTTATTAPEYYTSLEGMTADLRAAYEGLAAANPIFRGVAPVGAAFLAAVQNGTAIRDPYTTAPGTNGQVDLWWDDNLHASKYGSYLSALTLFGTITGLDPRSLGAVDQVASDLGIDAGIAVALQSVAAATLNLPLQGAHWTSPGQVTELQGTTTGLLASAGGFSFSDANRTDIHTVSVTPPADALGTLTAALHTDTTGDGSGGSVNWTYTVNDAAVEYLSAGATRVERFLVTLSDQNGGSSQREIAVTITGTNDAPVVAAALTSTAAEGAASYALNLLAGASDVDSADVLSVSGVTYTVDGVASTAPAGVSLSGSTLTVDPGNAAFDSLAVGQSRTIGISYTVADNHGGSVLQTETITITGTNDAPVAVDNAAALLQRTTALGNVLTNDSDVDIGDTLQVGRIVHGAASATVTTDGVQLAGDYGTVTIKADGSYSYAANREGTLAVGASGRDAFTYSVSDNHGGTTTAALSFTVTGSAQGDAGNNIIIAAAGSNTLSGGAGDDTVVLGFRLADAAISYDAAGHAVIDGPNGAHDVLSGFEHFQFTDGTVNENTGSALVDDLFYYVTNKDVWAAHADAETHYNQFGWHEGRDPNADFSTTGYLTANPDVAAANVNPLTHYDQFGWHEGRDPSVNFDNELYLSHNPDVKAAGIDPLTHYLAFGQAEGRQTYAAVGRASDLAVHPGFDAEYYLLANADVAKAALTAGGDSFAFAFNHYETYGWHEGRTPNAIFDVTGYLNAYADVSAANIDPLGHYEANGWREGRDPSASFDVKAYEAAYGDVAAAHIDPMLHYLQSGANEGRTAFNDGHFG